MNYDEIIANLLQELAKISKRITSVETSLGCTGSESRSITDRNTMDIVDTQDALCDLSELTDEQSADLETAACDLSEELDMRVSDLEQAVCDLSELIEKLNNK